MVGHYTLRIPSLFQRPAAAGVDTGVPADPPDKQECESESAGCQPCRAGRRSELAVAPSHGMVVYEPVSEGPAGWRGAGHMAGCEPCCDMSLGAPGGRQVRQAMTLAPA